MGMLLDAFDIIDNHHTARYKKVHRNHIDVWLEPDLGMMSMFSLKGVEMAYEKGYEIGKAHAKEIRKLYR